MISIPKYLVFLNIILLPLVSEAVVISKLSTVRSAEETKVTLKPTGHHHGLFHGQLRPVPPSTESLRAREQYPNFTYPSSAPFIQYLTATSSILTTRTGVRSNEQETGTTSQQAVGSTTNQSSVLFTTVTINNVPSPELSLSSTGSASISTGSGCPQTNHTVTVIVTEIESWSIPQSLGTKPIGPPLTLPPCPSQGPGLTPLGCVEPTSSAATPQPTTTYSWSDYNYNSTTSAKAISTTSKWNSYRPRDFTTPHATPCASNTALLCVELTLGAVNAALTSVLTSGNHSQTWKHADATPCADECMNIGSAIITIGPSTTSLSSNTAILSDLTNTASVLSSSLSALLGTSVSQISISLGESISSTPTSTSLSSSLSPGSPGPCSSNTSLECIVQGHRTITVGTPTSEASSTSESDSTSFFFSSSISTSSAATSSDSQPTITMTSTLPPLTSLPTQNNPPPSPSGFVQGSWAFKRFEIPMFLVLLCSLVSTVASIDIRSANYLTGRSNAPTSSVESDGNYGIGVPSASSTAPAAPPSTASFIQPVSASTLSSISATPFTTSFIQPAQETSSSFSPFPKSFIVPVTGSAASASFSTTPSPLKATSGSSKLRIPGLFLLFGALISRAAATIATPTPPNPFIGPQRCDGQTDFASCGVFNGSTVYLSPTSNPTFGSPHGGFSTVVVTAAPTATIVEPPVAAAAPPKGQTSGSSKAKIPFLLLLLCSLLSLASATTTSPTPPNPFIGPQTCAGQSDFANCAVFSGSTVWLSPTSTPTPTSTQGFSTVATKSATPTSSSSEQEAPFTTPRAPRPCVSNTSLECIVLGSNTVVVGTLSPQTTLVTASATTTSHVVSSSSTAPAASSKTASSGSSKVKVPFLMLLFHSLVSRAAAAITTSPQSIDGLQTPRTYDEHTFLEGYGGFNGSTFSSSPTPTPATQSIELPTSNPPGGPSTSSSTTQSISGLLIPHICNGHTFLESCLEFLTSQPPPPPGAPSTVVVIQTAGAASSQQGLSIVPVTAQATAASNIAPSATPSLPATSKTATSGSSKARIPSLFLLLCSRFALSAANLFPLPPAYSGYRNLSLK